MYQRLQTPQRERFQHRPAFRSLLFPILVLLFMLQPLSAQDANSGKISGILKDAASGEPMIGANIYLENTTLGAASDIDGFFLIDYVPAGNYTLIVSMIGYAEARIVNVKVDAGKNTQIEEIKIGSEALEGDEVVIEARFVQNTEAALLSKRAKTEAITDGLSAEAISRSGSSEAAEAMQQVTGASVVDGKYVYVRGLGERYASTQLNGVELPSADPDRRSFNLDLVPAKLLDNIVTQKTFTPDKPGNFSGGIVDMGIRSFPDELQINAGSGSGWNSQSSFVDNFLTYEGSSTDWLGFDDGARDLPEIANDPNLELPTEFEARFDGDKAQVLDQYTRAFNSQMAPTTKSIPTFYDANLSIGNTVNVLGRPLGFFGSLNYKRKYSFYDNGEVARWKLTGSVDVTDSLNNQTHLVDTKASEDVLWGALFTSGYQFAADHELQFNYLRTQSGNTTSRYLEGEWPEQISSGTLQTRALKYTERALSSYQVRGNHEFSGLGDLSINWIGSFAVTNQDEPDARFFSNTRNERTIGGRDTTIYGIPPSTLLPPSRFYRDLEEDNTSFQMHFQKPIRLTDATVMNIKFGGNYEEKSRDFNERLFEYQPGSGTARYAGDPVSFFNDGNIGITEFNETTNRYSIGNYIVESSNVLGGDYNGDQRVNAAFMMIDLPLFSKLRLIGGARYEATRMNVSNEEESGGLRDDDLLPSVNLNYKLFPNVDLRAAYGRTLARPNFREKAPYASYEFFNDFIFNGNVDLQRTLIDNFDLRYDWYPNPGELVSVSGFYKKFENPIERVIDVFFASEGALVFFDNVDEATVMGLEIEARKNLGFISGKLSNFNFGGNITFVNSEVTIPEDEYELIVALNPDADRQRTLQGQSPFLANANLSYTNPGSGSSVNMSYNVFGERLSEVSVGGTPNVFEQPRHMLNLSFSQNVMTDKLKFKFGAKNLLDQSHRFTHEFKGVEYVRQQYNTGRSFSLGLGYDF